jgi:phosphoribosyl 1,2-cyclic phosphate phosphodiesterase
MKLTLLGTGGSAGLPQIGGPDGKGDWGKTDPTEPRNRRTRTSAALTLDDGRVILIDTAPELRLQLTACGIARVDALLYTHAHADHVAGLDDIRILNRLLNAPMPGYATAPVWDELQTRFAYAFLPHDGKFFIRPVIAPHNVTPGGVAEIAGAPVLVFEQDHGFSASLGLRVGTLAYCTDVVRLSDAALATLNGLDLLVVDCFTTRDHPTHAGLPTVLSWVERLAPKRTVLTHLGPDMDYATLKRTLPAGIEPGFDGMELIP